MATTGIFWWVCHHRCKGAYAVISLPLIAQSGNPQCISWPSDARCKMPKAPSIQERNGTALVCNLPMPQKKRGRRSVGLMVISVIRRGSGPYCDPDNMDFPQDTLLCDNFPSCMSTDQLKARTSRSTIRCSWKQHGSNNGHRQGRKSRTG